jgi:hypothetical protein
MGLSRAKKEAEITKIESATVLSSVEHLISVDKCARTFATYLGPLCGGCDMYRAKSGSKELNELRCTHVLNRCNPEGCNRECRLRPQCPGLTTCKDLVELFLTKAVSVTSSSYNLFKSRAGQCQCKKKGNALSHDNVAQGKAINLLSSRICTC